MKRVVACLSMVLALLSCTRLAVAAGDGKIYATMSGEGGTAVIDPVALDAWGEIKSGKYSARAVASRDNSLVYVSLYDENKVKAIDVSLDKVVKEVKTGAGPYNMDLSPDGNLLLVCNDGGNSLSVIDTTTFKEVKRVDLAGSPVAIRISPDGKRAYLAVGDPKSVLNVLDMNSLLVVKKQEVPDQAYDMHFSPAGDRLYVNSAGAGKILVLDASTLQEVDSIETSRNFGIALSRDGSEVWFFGPEGELVSYSLEKKKTLAKLPIGGGPCGGRRINLSPDGKLLFAWPAGDGCDLVYVYDTAMKKKSGEIRLPYTPTWVTYIQK